MFCSKKLSKVNCAKSSCIVTVIVTKQFQRNSVYGKNLYKQKSCIVPAFIVVLSKRHFIVNSLCSDCRGCHFQLNSLLTSLWPPHSLVFLCSSKWSLQPLLKTRSKLYSSIVVIRNQYFLLSSITLSHSAFVKAVYHQSFVESIAVLQVILSSLGTSILKGILLSTYWIVDLFSLRLCCHSAD